MGGEEEKEEEEGGGGEGEIATDFEDGLYGLLYVMVISGTLGTIFLLLLLLPLVKSAGDFIWTCMGVTTFFMGCPLVTSRSRKSERGKCVICNGYLG